MKCPSCKKEIQDDAKFCAYCGTSFDRESVSDQPTAPNTGNGGGDESMGEMRTMAGKRSSSRKVEEGEVIATRYRIIEVLGAGGMGEVYRCLDMKLNRDVAVKRLLPDVKASKEGIDRFLREGQAIAGLNHQNIVQIHDFGEDEQGHYIVMELIEGKTLKEVIRERDDGKLSPEELGKVAAQIGRGLSYAHRKGVVHRDIKPGNIMLAKDGTVKITDFGLAQVASESELSMTGYGMGTLDYMPPEQRRDAKHTDHRADIYAFGATLYEMTTGKPPRIIRESEIPGEMREVILKAMEAKPEDRFFSVDEMVEALKKPGKTIDVSESDVKMGVCPSCGHSNPMEVKFCEECGAGMFEKCPKCEQEIRLGTKHCGYCGVNISEYKDLLDHLGSAKEYMAKHKYSRAKKEYEAALEIESDNQEAKKGLNDAEGKVGKIHELKEKIEEIRKSGEYEQELESLRELIGLIPGDIELRTRLEKIPNEIKQRDLRVLHRNIELARYEEKYEEEKRFLGELAALEGGNTEVEGRIAELNRLIKQRVFLKRFIDVEKGYFGWEEWKWPREVKEKKSGIEMILIEPGEFEMGSNTGDENEKPVHIVNLARPFYLGKYPVTQKQFQEVMGINPSLFKGVNNLPVDQVTWPEVKIFCENLGEGFRLPTETEWEYACRAGTQTAYYWGDHINGDYCWYQENSERVEIFSDRGPHPVGEKKPNPGGLYDMSGNVWEWCEDDYHNSYNMAPNDGSAWDGGRTGNSKVLRGGSWFSDPESLRSSHRIRLTPLSTRDNVGFRISWTL